jgi:leucyl-tRNA synthetase
LHGGDVKGRQVGPLGIKPEDLTDATWDYIFGRAGFPADATITKEQGEALRREYTYFYPMDIRSSGKDLIPNHLTFCIYVHSALFPESMWPRSMRANGHLMLNGKKMSKSTGNSLTLRDSVQKFGADATRLALADAGDAIEDANFDEDMANSQILRLYTFNDWCQTQLEDQADLRTGEKNFWDRGFEAEINRMIVIAKQSYIE